MNPKEEHRAQGKKDEVEQVTAQALYEIWREAEQKYSALAPFLPFMKSLQPPDWERLDEAQKARFEALAQVWNARSAAHRQDAERTRAYPWQPPTPQELYRAFRAAKALFHSSGMPGEEWNFPILYDRQVAEEGEMYEVLPGLFGRVDNYYVTHPGSLWPGSQIWIDSGTFKEWYERHQEQGA